MARTNPHEWPIDDAATAMVHDLIPICVAMGVQVLQADHDRAVGIRLPLAPNVNHVGTAYAGSLFTAAELLGGLLAMSAVALEGTMPLLRGMDIRYRRPAGGDVVAATSITVEEIARIRAEVQEAGRANFDLDCELTLPDGTVVAQSVGHYQVRSV